MDISSSSAAVLGSARQSWTCQAAGNCADRRQEPPPETPPVLVRTFTAHSSQHCPVLRSRLVFECSFLFHCYGSSLSVKLVKRCFCEIIVWDSLLRWYSFNAVRSLVWMNSCLPDAATQVFAPRIDYKVSYYFVLCRLLFWLLSWYSFIAFSTLVWVYRCLLHGYTIF